MQDTETHAIGGNKVFQMPVKPEILTENIALLTFPAAKETADNYLGAREAILADQRLSDLGKQERIEPLTEIALTLLGGHAENLAAFEFHLEGVDAELLAVDEPTTPYGISREKEVREWWRGLNDKQRLAVLDQFQDHPEKYRGVIDALLNSPLPAELKNHELDFVRETHRKVRRLARPDLANRLDEGRISLAWAKRGLAHILGHMGREPGFSREATLTHHAAKGNKSALDALGFSPSEIELAFRKQAAKNVSR